MFSLTAVLLLAGIAGAATSSDLESRLHKLWQLTGEPVLVGAVGAEVEKAVLKLDKRGAAGTLRVVRIPTVGDPQAEMDRALGLAGLRCGVKVEARDGGGWNFQEYGDCRSRAELRAEQQAAEEPASGDALRSLSQALTEVDDDDFEAVPLPETVRRTPSPHPQAAPSGAQPAPPSSPAPSFQYRQLYAVAEAYGAAPDPVVAWLNSAVIGFGTGHFYSGNPSEGWTHLTVQVGCLGLAGLGTLISTQANSGLGRDLGAGLLVVGSLGFSVGRVADIYRAPLSAQEERARLRSGR